MSYPKQMHSDWLAIKEASWAWRNPARQENYLTVVIGGELVPQKSDLARLVLENDRKRNTYLNRKKAAERLKSKWAKAATA